MAYGTRMAAALTGATPRQLRYWRTEPVAFSPEVSTEPPVYSFRDLVALRSFVYLRRRVSLQRIRGALRNLRDLGNLEHLSTYTLFVQGKSVVVVDAEGLRGLDLIDRPGQRVLFLAALDAVMKPFPVGETEVPDLRRPRDEIAIHPQVHRGHPVVQGTRVAYDLVAGMVRDGVPPEAIQDYYPGVSARAARDAVAFADYVDRVTGSRVA